MTFDEEREVRQQKEKVVRENRIHDMYGVAQILTDQALGEGTVKWVSTATDICAYTVGKLEFSDNHPYGPLVLHATADHFNSKDRWSFSMLWPSDSHNHSHTPRMGEDFGALSITASANKTPKVLARDLENRLLHYAQAAYAAMLERVASSNSYREACEANAKILVDRFGERGATLAHQRQINTTANEVYFAGGGNSSAYIGNVTCSDNGVSVKHLSMNMEQAQKVFDILLPKAEKKVAQEA